ncbi:hypothetical protein SAMN05444166_3482 [Singulisphaera sp. GP187]|uniref:exo-alpha-sialidase n=1 Tax=Singulisphaera sp. GP187 TaxID=1882752 RepID=UPI0009270D41|nr:exo-alpha-sialidase [Singulisphaera sp. GP187]SIO28406.1 hypothetical protein SAMN05444166_3482 [Singulisphaera sp. GP187]
MPTSRSTSWILGIIFLFGTLLNAYHKPVDDSTPGDQELLPVPPVFAEQARPVLMDSGPLPATQKTPAKPVVIADHKHRVVVIDHESLDLTMNHRLIQWCSNDRGRSWQQPVILENWPADSAFMADPWLQTDRRGRLFLVHTTVPDGSLILRGSVDSGQSWHQPITVAEGADRPVLGISPNGKRLVIAASISERTAEYPKRPLNSDDPLLKQKLKAAFRHALGIYHSEDRGRHWSRLPEPGGLPHTIPFAVVTDDAGRLAVSGVAEGQGSRSVVSTTADRGKTWTELELVGNLQPDRDHPFNGERFPVLAVDGNANLHVAFVAALGKELLVRRGMNWSRWDDPSMLSTRDPEAVRMPAIAAWGPMVHLTWMERQNDRWRNYYRGSKDYGRHWSEPLLLSVPHVGTELINPAGFDRVSDDDQSCITDDGTGTAHAVWSVLSPHPVEIPGRVWHATIEWKTPQHNSH